MHYAVLIRLTLSSFAAALFAAGCTGGSAAEPLEIVFDPCEPIALEIAAGALPEERTSAADAAAMWNEGASAHLTLEAGPAAPAARLPIRFEEAAPIFYGVYEDEIGEIIINRSLADRRERAVTIAHEIGHAFGLLHVDESERRSLMNPGNLETGLTAEDLARLEALWGRCAD